MRDHPAEKAADEVLDDLARVYGEIPPEARDAVDGMRYRWKTFGKPNDSDRDD